MTLVLMMVVLAFGLLYVAVVAESGRCRKPQPASASRFPSALRTGVTLGSPSRFASARSPRTFLIYSSFDGLSDDFRV